MISYNYSAQNRAVTLEDYYAIIFKMPGKYGVPFKFSTSLKNNKIIYIILSVFDSNNQLRTLYKDSALIDFWIDSKDYGVVECVHEIILHSVI